MASSAPMITVTNAASYQTELNQMKQKQKQKEEENEEYPSTYLDEPPHYEIKDMSPADQKDLLKNSESIFSSSTLTSSTSFNPTKKLLIHAKGISVLRFPGPPSEMQVHITMASKELVYMSRRVKRSSGDAVLTSKDGVALVRSEYQWGPGRDPKLWVLHGDGRAGEVINVKGEWTSRTQLFKPTEGKEGFVWRYVKEFDAVSGKKMTSMIMEMDAASIEKASIEKAADHNGTRRVAQLVRNEETRTLGTKSSSAGNGGELLIDEDALEETSVGELVVVASCLMMLKKEIDRRRTIQMMAMAGAASGGS